MRGDQKLELARQCFVVMYANPQSDGFSCADENIKRKLKEKNIEVQKMKKAVESLMAANEEKVPRGTQILCSVYLCSILTVTRTKGPSLSLLPECAQAQ